MNIRLLKGLSAVVLCIGMAGSTFAAELWVDSAASSPLTQGNKGQVILDMAEPPERFRQVSLDNQVLESLLMPLDSATAGAETIIITLPLPDGRMLDFEVWRTSTMEPALAAKYPQFKTYAGQGFNDPEYSVRFDWTPNGFNAIILAGEQTLFIAPVKRGQRNEHISFNDKDVIKQEWVEPEVIERAPPPKKGKKKGVSRIEATAIVPRTSFTPGSEILLFRIAVTGSQYFTSANGGSVATALNTIVTKVNQVNAIYEREFSFRFVLVGENDQIVFTAANDPGFVNSNTSSNFPLNQTTVDSIIGDSNYDIGHLLLGSGAGGGVANYNSACNPGSKTRGSNGGSSISVQTFAHEVGHQFSFPHTWNSTVCNSNYPGQWQSSNAYEPGAGNTIMSYAGSCGADNIGSRLNQFHIVSFDQAMDYVVAPNTGEACGQLFNIEENTRPAVDAGSTNLTFPVSTPFVLSGVTSDAEGDALTHSWEEFDLPSAAAAPDDGEVPFFKVFGAVPESSRTFPQMSDVVNGVSTLGEQLPSTNQSLNMRLHVYDNYAGAGGVNHDDMNLDFAASAGPFVVTSPNGAEVWQHGASETVTWNIASTNSTPVYCSQVDIDLSNDGGYTYPVSLASGTANDGSQAITVPASVISSSARVRVRCSLQRDTANAVDVTDHYFFDISDANLTVQAAPPSGCTTSLVVKDLGDSGACTLRDTITAASAGSTITFDASLNGGMITLATELVITKSLTIDGGDRNITVSGNNAGRVFYINSNAVTLSRLTIADGNCISGCTVNSDKGGGVLTDGSSNNVTIDRVVFQNNTAHGGGAIYNDFARLQVTNSTFDSNSARFTGGALNSRSWNTSPITVVVDKSTFKNNSANYYSNSKGGALFSDYEGLAVRNSTFNGNTAYGNGGAIASESTFSNSSAVLELTNVTISNNNTNVSNGGGGLYIGDNGGASAQTTTITNTIIANSTNGGDCFTNYSHGSSALTETNNIVEDNTCGFTGGSDPVLGALQSNGGDTETHALLAGSPAIDAGDNTTCEGSDINDVDQRGYGRTDSTCDIGAFEANASAPGGAPTVTPATFSVAEGAALGTTVGTVTASGGTNPLSFSISGGNPDETFVINSSTGVITVNRNRLLNIQTNPQFLLLVNATDSGAPPLAGSETITINVSDVNLPPVAEDATYSLNGSSPNGTLVGNAPATDPDGDVLLYAITAGNTGDAFVISPISGDITVADNSGFGGSPTFNLTVQVTDNGTGTLSDTSTITVEVTTCSTNVVSSTADSGTCTLRDAIATASAGDTITFAASMNGATITLASQLEVTKSLTIDGGDRNVTVSGNNAGRVFYINSNAVTLSRLTIADGDCISGCPTSSDKGGGVYAEGSSNNITIDRVIFQNNTAGSGGAIHNYFARIQVTNSTFESNSARYVGGALYSRSWNSSPITVVVDKSTFKNNSATYYSNAKGGALYSDYRGMAVRNSTFNGNSARGNGGAIASESYFSNSSAVLELTNVTISSNNTIASNAGGGIYIGDNGGASAQTTTMINTIIANSTNGGDCLTAHSNGSSVLTENNNIVEDNTCGFTGGSDPVLGALQNNGGDTETHALLTGSPAIDAGDNATCAGSAINNVDQRGYGRTDATCDIGAYEDGAPAPSAPTWDGGGLTNNWSDAYNWLDNTVPPAGSAVVFDATSTKDAIVDVSFAGSIGSLFISDDYDGSITLARSLQVQGDATVGNSVTLDLATELLTVDGTFTNNGRLRQTKAVTAVGTGVEFFHITNLAVTSDKYFGLTITPTASSMGNVIAEVRGNQERCTDNSNDEVVRRCFDINPTNQVAATLRFYYSEAERNDQRSSLLKTWHLDTSSAVWSEIGSNIQQSESDFICVSGVGEACWTQVEGVSSYSPFVLGSGDKPSPVCKSTLSLVADTWTLIGLPCDPGKFNTIGDVLAGSDDELTAAGYDVTWVVWDWDETNQNYGTSLPMNARLEQGQGYWIFSEVAADITVGSAHAGVPSFTIPLVSSAGGSWNMLSHTFLNSTNWADVVINDGASNLTLAQADPIVDSQRACEQEPVASECVFSSVMHKWNGAAYQAIDLVTNPGSMDDFDGFWVKAYQASTMKIPAPGTSIPSASPASTASRMTPQSTSPSTSKAAKEPSQPTEWKIRLTAQSGELSDPGNLFGVYADSLEGRDYHDLKELRPFSSDYLTVVFPYPEWDEKAFGFTTDFRPAETNGKKSKRQVWEFEVRSGIIGREVTLSWQGPEQILKKSTLIDLQTGEEFRPGKQGNISFTVDGTRSFRWETK